MIVNSNFNYPLPLEEEVDEFLFPTKKVADRDFAALFDTIVTHSPYTNIMSIFHRLKINKSKSESNLPLHSRESDEAILGYRIVSPTSSTSSENDNLTEIVEPNEIEFTKATIDFTYSDEEEDYDDDDDGIDDQVEADIQIANLKKLSKKQLRIKLEDVYSEKLVLIKEFTKIIDFKEKELEKHRKDLSDMQGKYLKREQLLQAQIDDLEDKNLKAEKYEEYLNKNITNDVEILSIAQNEIFEVGMYLTELLKEDREEFEFHMVMARTNLKNYLANDHLQEINEPPVNCQVVIPLLEKVGLEFLRYESTIKNQNNIIKEIVSLTESLTHGLRFILDDKTSESLEKIIPSILKSEMVNNNGEIAEYCHLVGQIIHEVGAYTNGHKRMIRMIQTKND